MTQTTAILILMLAALLEAGGDAVVRIALHRPEGGARIGLFCAGAVILFAYGYTVNAPSWDFGKFLGLYVVFFFLIAQVLSWVVFHQPPSKAVLLGGAFITVGGLVIALSQA